MATYESLRQAIDTLIKTNGNEEITGAILNNVLNAMITALGANYQFCGEATPSTNPGQPMQNVFYFAYDAGTYVNFGNITLPMGISTLSWDGTQWTGDTIYQIDSTPNLDSTKLITSGAVYNAILSVFNGIGYGKVFAGIAVPSTTPEPINGIRMFYIATQAGTYEHFFANGDITLVLPHDGLYVIYSTTEDDDWNWEEIVGFDDVPTSGSDNLVRSGEVFNELALGAVYDVSAKNPTAGPNNDGKFTSLSALLSDANLNTLIPLAFRKGGMSIKYVQSSDNKYMQFRYMGTSTAVADFTNVDNWQGIDNEPTAGSDNLVKSGGVYKSLFESYQYQDIIKTIEVSQASGHRQPYNMTFNHGKVVYVKILENSVTMTGDKASIIYTKNNVSQSAIPINKAAGTTYKLEVENGDITSLMVDFPNITAGGTIAVEVIHGNAAQIISNNEKDTTPTEGSTRAVTSDGIKAAMDSQAAALTQNLTVTPSESPLNTNNKAVALTINGTEKNIKDSALTDRFNPFQLDVIGKIFDIESYTLTGNGGMINKLMLLDISNLNGKELIISMDAITASNDSPKGSVSALYYTGSQADELIGSISKNGGTITFTIDESKGNSIGLIFRVNDSVQDVTYSIHNLQIKSTESSLSDRLTSVETKEQEDRLSISENKEDINAETLRINTLYRGIDPYFLNIENYEYESRGAARERAFSRTIENIGDLIGKHLIFSTLGVESEGDMSHCNCDVYFWDASDSLISYKRIGTGGTSEMADVLVPTDTHHISVQGYTNNSTSSTSPATYIFKGVELKCKETVFDSFPYPKSNLIGKELFTICDSIGVPGTWQNEIVKITGCTFDNNKNNLPSAPISVGGTKTFGNNREMGLSRAMNLKKMGYSPDIILLENVNDTRPATDDSIDDKPFYLSQWISGYSYDDWENDATALLNSIPVANRKLYSALELMRDEVGKNLKITHLPTADGDITLTFTGVGSETLVYNIHILASDTLSDILAKILEIDYEFIYDVMGQDGESVDFASTWPSSPASNMNVTFNGGTTGVTATVTSTSTAKVTENKFFDGDTLDDWSESSKWIDNISFYRGWKGEIEYLKKEFPNALIVMLLFPKFRINLSDYTRPDGTYDQSAWYNNHYSVYTKVQRDAQRAVAELYNIPIIDAHANVGICLANYLNYYNNNNVHPKPNGYVMIGKYIARQLLAISNI